MEEKIEMCQYYTTTGYPTFKPVCQKRYKASLRCHSTRKDCPDYKSEGVSNEEV